MATETRVRELSPALQRIIEKHRAEVARLRAEFGDPNEALDAFVRKTFDPDALAWALEEDLAGRGMWERGDEVDPDG